MRGGECHDPLPAILPVMGLDKVENRRERERGADLGSLQRAPPRHKTGATQVLEHINTVTSAEANLDAGGGGRVVQCLGALDDSVNAPLTVRE